jgi:hypothetical protein
VDSLAHVIWLGRQIEGWFLTATGKNMALAEQKLRLIELENSATPHKTDDRVGG